MGQNEKRRMKDGKHDARAERTHNVLLKWGGGGEGWGQIFITVSRLHRKCGWCARLCALHSHARIWSHLVVELVAEEVLPEGVGQVQDGGDDHAEGGKREGRRGINTQPGVGGVGRGGGGNNLR